MKYKIKLGIFKEISIQRDNKKVCFNGNFSLPSTKVFKDEESADAFVEGIIWAVKYYNGSVTKE